MIAVCLFSWWVSFSHSSRVQWIRNSFRVRLQGRQGNWFRFYKFQLFFVLPSDINNKRIWFLFDWKITWHICSVWASSSLFLVKCTQNQAHASSWKRGYAVCGRFIEPLIPSSLIPTIDCRWRDVTETASDVTHRTRRRWFMGETEEEMKGRRKGWGKGREAFGGVFNDGGRWSFMVERIKETKENQKQKVLLMKQSKRRNRRPYYTLSVQQIL